MPATWQALKSFIWFSLMPFLNDLCSISEFIRDLGNFFGNPKVLTHCQSIESVQGVFFWTHIPFQSPPFFVTLSNKSTLFVIPSGEEDKERKNQKKRGPKGQFGQKTNLAIGALWRSTQLHKNLLRIFGPYFGPILTKSFMPFHWFPKLLGQFGPFPFLLRPLLFDRLPADIFINDLWILIGRIHW